MSEKEKIREELKVWIYYELVKLSEEKGGTLTYEEVNSALIDILHENSQHNPNDLFKR